MCVCASVCAGGNLERAQDGICSHTDDGCVFVRDCG